jgi:hypothetical protein
LAGRAFQVHIIWFVTPLLFFCGILGPVGVYAVSQLIQKGVKEGVAACTGLRNNSRNARTSTSTASSSLSASPRDDSSQRLRPNRNPSLSPCINIIGNGVADGGVEAHRNDVPDEPGFNLVNVPTPESRQVFYMA